MDFKFILGILVIILISSCKREEDAWNEVRILNSTNDTLFITIGVNQSDINFESESGREFYLYPSDNKLIARASSTEGLDIINDNWGNDTDSVFVFRNRALLIKWSPPMQNLSDNFHSFFNENSWVLSQNENGFSIITYTIINEDFE